MKTKNPTLDFIHNVSRAGVGTMRLRISKEEAERIRAAERKGGQAAGVQVILELLRKPQP